MEHIFKDFTELIGNTPLIELNKYGPKHCPGVRLLAKLERQNPAGSVKDRVAYEIIKDAERDGTLSPGGLIIEATSGNTGVGIAAVAAVLGYRAVLVMPETMSVERIKLMRAYGAEIVLTPGAEGMAGAVKKAEEIHSENPGSIVAGQFENAATARVHYKTTAPEIWRDTDGKLDAFVACVGTGGTITGAGRYFKEQKSSVKIFAVEPEKSPLLSAGKAGPHRIQGIGPNFVPGVLDRTVYDEIILASEDRAFEAMAELAKTEGLLCGISSGAALEAAAEVAKKPEMQGKTIVVLLPDTGERYLSIFSV